MSTIAVKNPRIALLGQPNSGKSTLFNGLTGARQRVGNWPGKTVEKKEGHYEINGTRYHVTDLPGSYSLSANSEEEIITRDHIASGQVDFVRGANMSKGGKSIIAMPSTAGGGKISKIVPFIAEGSSVTTSRHDVGYIVTEYGVAELRGKTLRDRAKALIAIAHPDFKNELQEEFDRRYP